MFGVVVGHWEGGRDGIEGVVGRDVKRERFIAQGEFFVFHHVFVFIWWRRFVEEKKDEVVEEKTDVKEPVVEKAEEDKQKD